MTSRRKIEEHRLRKRERRKRDKKTRIEKETTIRETEKERLDFQEKNLNMVQDLNHGSPDHLKI